MKPGPLSPEAAPYTTAEIESMGKKGKGRLRAARSADIQRQASHVRLARPKHFGDRSGRTGQGNVDDANKARRPRLTGFSLLKHVLRERQSQEQHELMERRRRQGFLPQQPQGQGNPETTTTGEQQNDHPPGWMLRYNETGHDDDDQEGILCSPSHRRETPTMQRQRQRHRLEQQESQSIHPIHHEAARDNEDNDMAGTTTTSKIKLNLFKVNVCEF